jgi:hypothetical protein
VQVHKRGQVSGSGAACGLRRSIMKGGVGQGSELSCLEAGTLKREREKGIYKLKFTIKMFYHLVFNIFFF